MGFDLLRFFSPLALTAVLMGAAHTIITGMLARMAMPEATLAAYSLALGASAVAEAPFTMVRHLSLALGGAQGGLRRTAQVVSVFLFPLLLLEFLLAYTKTGQALFRATLGVPPQLVDQTMAAFRVLMFMAPATALRFLFQGYLVRYRHTVEISGGIALRMAYVVVGGLAMVKWLNLPGPVIGGLLLVGGVAAEALVCGVAALRLRRTASPLDDTAPPSLARGIRMFLPLAGSAPLASAVQPVINLSLARTPDPGMALAAYAAAYVVAVPIWLPLQNMHQMAVVFAEDEEGRRGSRRFGLAAGIIASAVMAALAFTPPGEWLLMRGLQLKVALAVAVRASLSVQALLPLAVGWGDFHLGLLLRQGRTQIAGLSRAINVLSVILLASLLLPFARTATWAATIGSAVYAVGYAMEGAVNALAVSRPGALARRSRAAR